MKSAEDYAAICSKLIEGLDSAREGWFSRCKEFLMEDGILINTEFMDDTDIGIQESDIPKYFQYFPFKYVSGQNVEAAIIGWQISATTLFIDENNYIPIDPEQEFIKIMGEVAAMKSDLWTLGGMAYALFDIKDFGGGLNRDAIIGIGNDLSQVIAYYLTNEKKNNYKVETAKKILNMAVLLGLTHMWVAVAFGDYTTADQIMERMKSD